MTEESLDEPDGLLCLPDLWFHGPRNYATFRNGLPELGKSG